MEIKDLKLEINKTVIEDLKIAKETMKKIINEKKDLIENINNIFNQKYIDQMITNIENCYIPCFENDEIYLSDNQQAIEGYIQKIQKEYENISESFKNLKFVSYFLTLDNIFKKIIDYKTSINKPAEILHQTQKEIEISIEESFFKINDNNDNNISNYSSKFYGEDDNNINDNINIINIEKENNLKCDNCHNDKAILKCINRDCCDFIFCKKCSENKINISRNHELIAINYENQIKEESFLIFSSDIINSLIYKVNYLLLSENKIYPIISKEKTDNLDFQQNFIIEINDSFSKLAKIKKENYKLSNYTLENCHLNTRLFGKIIDFIGKNKIYKNYFFLILCQKVLSIRIFIEQKWNIKKKKILRKSHS